MIPVFRVPSIDAVLPFYRDVLGFTVHDIGADIAPFYAVLSRDGDELHLQQDAGAEGCRHSAIMRVEAVDNVFGELKSRGFRPPDRPESPVHCAPVDQTWGTRELYVDDPCGNTLCFAEDRTSAS